MEETTIPAPAVADNVGSAVQETAPTEETAIPAQEEKSEQATPAQVDNVVEAAPEMTELERKVLDQSAKLRGSKEEALRLKAEIDALKAQIPANGQATDEQQFSEKDLMLFKQLAEKAGITQNVVTKQEIYKEQESEALHSFLKEHPEYAKEGDPQSDAAWLEVKAELELYKPPTKGSDWKILLERAHKSRSNDSQIALERGKSLGMAQAKIQEKGTLGSVSSGGSSAPSRKSPDQQAIEDGFKEAAPEYFS